MQARAREFWPACYVTNMASKKFEHRFASSHTQKGSSLFCRIHLKPSASKFRGFKSHPHRFQHRQGLALVVARVLFIWTEPVMNLEWKPLHSGYTQRSEAFFKKVSRSKMPKGSTCCTVDSGSALSSKKLLFLGKGQGYRMKGKEDTTNCYARHH